MSVIMMGTEVAASAREQLSSEVLELQKQGVRPCLGIVRVGTRPDDLAYERGARKRMASVGIECKVLELPVEINQNEFESAFQEVNADPMIHGILLFRPLPDHLDEEPVKAMINPFKDVDCMSQVNIAKVFSGDETGYAPCTPEAVMDMLEYYRIDLTGREITVIGRSMVVGKPLAMMLLKKNATVTICHTRTQNMAATCRRADILIAAAGKARMVGPELVGRDTIVIDVGINVDEDGQLCGDIDFDEVQSKVSYITPVPGGVGSVTSTVLAKHVIRAAKYLSAES